MSLTISLEALGRIQEIRARRETDFHHLGVAVAEHALHVRGIDGKYSGDELLRKHGELELDLDRHRTTILTRIAGSLTDQKTAGEAALAELGLDHVRRELVIDEKTGEVRELVAGRYVGVKG